MKWICQGCFKESKDGKPYCTNCGVELNWKDAHERYKENPEGWEATSTIGIYPMEKFLKEKM